MNVKSDKDFLEITLLAAAIFCVVAVGFCALAGYDFIVTARQESAATDQHLNRVLIVAGATLGNIEKASRSIDDREQAELKQLNAVMGGLQVTVGKVNGTVDSLNFLITDTDRQMVKVTEHADLTIQASTPAVNALTVDLQKFGTTLDTTQKVFGDPAIPMMIASMARSANNVEGITGDLHKITLSGVDTADQLDQSAKAFTVAVKRETRPASFALKSVEFLLGQGSNVANILKGFGVVQ